MPNETARPAEEFLWNLLGVVELTYHPALAVTLLFAIDYLVISIVVVVLAFVLSVNGTPLPDGRAGLLALLGLAVVVQVADVGLSKWRSSPIDAVVRLVLRPVRDPIRDRLVTVEMVPERTIAATARPTPVAGFVGGPRTSILARQSR
jgi:hypothetical protein